MIFHVLAYSQRRFYPRDRTKYTHRFDITPATDGGWSGSTCVFLFGCSLSADTMMGTAALTNWHMTHTVVTNHTCSLACPQVFRAQTNHDLFPRCKFKHGIIILIPHNA
jgi:hypothetical protein